jgi:hypothetical protein
MRWGALAAAIAVLFSLGDAAAENTPVNVVVTTWKNDPRLVLQWKREVSFEVVEGESEWRVRFGEKGPIDRKALAKASAFKPRVIEEGEGETLFLTVPADRFVRPARSGASIVLDIAPLPPGKQKPKPAAPARVQEAKPTPKAEEAKPAPKAEEAHSPPARLSPKPAEAKASAKTEPQVLRVAAASKEDGTTLRFEAPRALPAAMFRRGEKFWIVFGQAIATDLSEARQAGVTLELLAHPEATLFRLALPESVNPSLTRNGTTWELELRPQALRPELPIAVEARPGVSPPRVVFGLKQAGLPLDLVDPETGERLLVVPGAEAGQGMGRTVSFVDFRALRTLQGLALRMNADGLTARAVGDTVEVTSASGLVLSGAPDRLARSAPAARERLFDFAAWGSQGNDHTARRRALQTAAAEAAPEARTVPRLDLARLLFADGYGAEAAGVLAAIERDDPGAFVDPSLRALRGASAFLAGDRETAAKDLSIRELDRDPEAALWRGAIRASAGEWQAAWKDFARGAQALPQVPKKLRHGFAITAAEAAIAAGPREAARPLLESVLLEEPERGPRGQALLLAARLKRSAGDAEGAIKIWDEVLAEGERPSRARAQLDKTLAQQELGQITRPEAINRLDALRYEWRGDDVEFTALRRGAELRIAEGDWRGAFEALRQAQANFPEHPEVKTVAKQAQDAVYRLFEGTDTEVPPLRSLALFEQHRDLLPDGSRGDAIVRKLADRLAGVDLPDRAASLLESHMKAQSGSGDRARDATRIAELRLQDRKPQAALDTLAASEKSAPAELAVERGRIKAKALTELGKTQEALAAIEKDEAPEADRLRVDLLWRAKDWASAAKSLQRLVQRASNGGALDDEGAKLVLNWATALTLSGDAATLAALQEKYGAAMEKSSHRAAFRAVTAGEVKKVSALN